MESRVKGCEDPNAFDPLEYEGLLPEDIRSLGTTATKNDKAYFVKKKKKKSLIKFYYEFPLKLMKKTYPAVVAWR